MGSAETTPRERLVAMVAVLAHPKVGIGNVNGAWQLGEAFVAAMEAEPEKPRECPCCTKLVVCCQLTEPGKPCVECRRVE